MRKYQRFCGSLAFASAVLSGFAVPATATNYHVDGAITEVANGHQFPIDSYSKDLGVQAGGQLNYNFPGEHAQADSIAEGFGVRSHTFSQLIAPLGQLEMISDATAIATFTDMVISGPTGGTVSTSINFDLTGGIIASSTADPASPGVATGSVSVLVFVNGIKVGDGFHFDRVYTQFGPQTSSTGMLANWNSGTPGIFTPAFDVQSGVPFTVKLEIQTETDVFANGSAGSSEANSDFSHTLTFSLTGPVFNLPAGYTADSPDAHITANHAVGVPEPASCAILGAALLAISFRRRR